MIEKEPELSREDKILNAHILNWSPITPESYDIIRFPCVIRVTKFGGQLGRVDYMEFGMCDKSNVAFVGDVLYQTTDFRWHHLPFKKFEELVASNILDNV